MRTLVRRAALALGLTALLLTPAAVTSAPAAARGISSCSYAELGVLCGWDAAQYGGNPITYSIMAWSGTCVNAGGSTAARISSLWNRASRSVRIYEGYNCTGQYSSFGPNMNVGQLPNAGSDVLSDNSARSWRWIV